MNTSKKHGLPAKLEAVRQRFERWRLTHKPRTRIPNSLWMAAVTMAGTHGIHRVARALRLDYYSLKERVEQHALAGLDPADKITAVPFLELVPPAQVSSCDCTLELEDAAGAKMRVHLKAAAPPDLAAISRSFWNPAS